MIRKSFSLILASMLVSIALNIKPVLASSIPKKQSQSTDQVKAAIQRLGIGPDARVEVTLRDNKKLTGYISKIDDDSFVITNPKTGNAITVDYNDVTQVKARNQSRHRRPYLAIAVAAGILIVAIVAASQLP